MRVEPLLQLSNVRKTFPKASGELLVLDDINLSIRTGEIVGLLGRSGSGKSTLLRIIAGLHPPSGGAALFQGQPIDGPAAGVALVFQSFALFPWLTVLGNVSLGLRAMGVDDNEARRRALEAIDLIGLDGFESAYPRELSGGMQQRVGFARALVVDPVLMLMDEPFSALDVLTAETLRTDFLDLWTEGRTQIRSVVLVTHNIEEAVFLCDRIIVLASDPGRVQAEVTIDLPHPRDRLSAAFSQMVENVYAILTARPAAAARAAAPPIALPLRDVSINAMAGLLETVAGAPYRGRGDLPVIAHSLQLELNDLFPVADGLQRLGLAEVEQGDITLTAAGLAYADADTQQRKAIFRAHALRNVPLIAHILGVLQARPNGSAPRVRFEAELEDHLSEKDALETLDVAIDWGRYAEVYEYDDTSQWLLLEQAQTAPAPARNDQG